MYSASNLKSKFFMISVTAGKAQRTEVTGD